MGSTTLDGEPQTGLPEPIFKRAVVAVGFTPNLQAVLNEAHALLKIMGAVPIIVHVGEDSAAVRQKLEENIQKSNFREHPPIYLVSGGSTPDVLIKVANEYEADLICAGALKREKAFRYYFGSVARNIARHAPCSVMLFAEPSIEPKPLAKIHCAVEFEEETIQVVKVAAGIAYFAGSKELYVTHCFPMPQTDDKKSSASSQAIDPSTIYKERDAMLTAYLQQVDFSGINVQLRCMQEKTHSTTIDFTRDIEADLLVIPTSQNGFGLWNQLMHYDVESALVNLPCSLLMVRTGKD
ncbi:MAG TPA: universal stress protein [bacterium]|nr:universal stress protein [bacterium]